jgi:iron-sulfur cluster repair protein YtfE (RIC family)
MQITKGLLGEHAVFYVQFDYLEEKGLAADGPIPLHSQLELLGSALSAHAQLEDELLFTRLEPCLGPAGPLAVMRTEHEQLEQALASAQESRELAEVGDWTVYIVRLAREHFAKEERILFPMAEQVLGADVLDQLGAEWARLRGLAPVAHLCRAAFPE